ncbi:hypothetical protein K4F52_003133 [Lecanicillium sp. MT-2017a]|nr:hypothetical protein K4F52_003133 [Lecanicillium sp. MT-2017a]
MLTGNVLSAPVLDNRAILASGPGGEPASAPPGTVWNKSMAGDEPASGPGGEPASGPGGEPASGPGGEPASGPGGEPASGPGGEPAAMGNTPPSTG